MADWTAGVIATDPVAKYQSYVAAVRNGAVSTGKTGNHVIQDYFHACALSQATLAVM